MNTQTFMIDYPKSPEEIQAYLKNGLSQEEAAKRLGQFGPNQLKEKKKKSTFQLFLDQFKDFMITILVIAAIFSGIAGEWSDTIIILVIVVLNAIMGFVQEYRAEKAMESLKKMSEVQSQVIRGGKNQVLPSRDLVPGDLVLCEAGNMIPADIQLLEENAIKVDESSLTGESVPVEKEASKSITPSAEIDSPTHLFKGTLQTNGRGMGIILATGMNTQLGKIADLLQEKRPNTPLQIRMEKFGKTISLFILLICLVIFGMGILRGEDPIPLMLVSVSLAVAAIPEALPALITIALSLGAARLAKKETLIRKLPAVESLGSITFICTDKTGTLTKNQMKVVRKEASQDSLPEGNVPLQLAMALNHDIQSNEEGDFMGEATELALVEHIVEDLGQKEYEQIQEKYPRVGEIPFDSERKRMSTFHQFEDHVLVICKGATETILDVLEKDISSEEIIKMSDQWASEGERVLAFAGKLIPSLPAEEEWENLEKDLSFWGLAGMIDPPREEVKEAIQECKTAGIQPVMITGDHPETAKTIAEQVGILEEGRLSISGSELRELSDEDFEKQIEKISVYARVSPDQKLRIVKTLQSKGQFVAMTGDGVNDAPSLRASTIGVAMGITGTDVSKEAAHMILLDDNFATIVRAIREGRRIFDNIRKFIKYIMTCNGAEILTITLAPFLGMPIPLLPIHILWINLVTDGIPALALAKEKAESNIMKRPPRPPKQSLFADGVGIHILWVGTLMAAVTLFTQYWAIRNEWHWQTMVFSVLAFSQLGHVMAVRSDRDFLFKQGLFSNLPLILAVLGMIALQILVIYVPVFNKLFHTEALNLPELLICGGMGLVVFHAVEMEKLVKKWRRNS
ncbi:calcium-translocating P-type ATPase, PMCA-type [Algoriphagus sp. NF]|uniref:calcium-translocating P-type ATPase, PMCA-type n=1 Tax=Algoriphagus sp. NF TaxID=2992756 RepID=UPI00237A67C7|nr:calcium-translocating P-type ATPase, PMCA-type [Algoriphagus sp. NF]MDE0559037.1 calcium-translocating P-type ATPase, PMCA-type [Algoriphagus sp. NF]